MILLTPTKGLPRHLKIEATNLKVRKKKKKRIQARYHRQKHSRDKIPWKTKGANKPHDAGECLTFTTASITTGNHGPCWGRVVMYLFRKYISHVLTIRGGRRCSAVGLSMYPSWYMDLTAWVTSLATCLVWSSWSSLYVSLSERCCKPVSMYSCLSCITTVDPLSAFSVCSYFSQQRVITYL